eukprot:6091567-Alexandrium_andersonii.AAC.1
MYATRLPRHSAARAVAKATKPKSSATAMMVSRSSFSPRAALAATTRPATSARAATMLRQSQAACASGVASLDTNTTRAASPGRA